MKSEIKIGDEVYYTMEDYNTGEDVIYKGYIVGFDDDRELSYNDQYIKLDRFYNISDKPSGEMIVGIQRNALYTVEDLFDIKKDRDRLEEIASKLVTYLFNKNGEMIIFYRDAGMTYKEFNRLYKIPEDCNRNE